MGSVAPLGGEEGYLFFGGVMATKAEKEHMARVAGLGCIACYNMGYEDSPASIHHIRHGVGMSQRASHKLTLPLCGPHHQTGGYGVAIHAGQKKWEEIHGTELELLEQVYEMLGELMPEI